MGLTGYHRRFIDGYGTIAKPLTDLTRKGSFQWSELASQSFQQLKDKLITTHVNALPNFFEPFVIETNASETGIRAFLMKDKQPITFFNQTLCPKNQPLSTYEKELLAIMSVVSKWSSYLIGVKFIIRTDHLSLKCLKDQKITLYNKIGCINL